jgi:hypothetical protein
VNESAYAKIVEAFAILGSRIINIDRMAHYKHIGGLSKRKLEPGYIPVDSPPRVVTISFYPNETELESETYKKSRDSFLNWGLVGNAEAYEAAYVDWLAALPSFPFHRDFDRPIFDAVEVKDSAFAWLPLVKGPLPARSVVADDDVFSDRMLLWDQLALLRPRVILAQGMAAADVVKPMCDGKFPHRIVIQKIGRYGTTAARRAEDERVIRELSVALGSEDGG